MTTEMQHPPHVDTYAYRTAEWLSDRLAGAGTRLLRVAMDLHEHERRYRIANTRGAKDSKGVPQPAGLVGGKARELRTRYGLRAPLAALGIASKSSSSEAQRTRFRQVALWLVFPPARKWTADRVG